MDITRDVKDSVPRPFSHHSTQEMELGLLVLNMWPSYDAICFSNSFSYSPVVVWEHLIKEIFINKFSAYARL